MLSPLSYTPVRDHAGSSTQTVEVASQRPENAGRGQNGVEWGGFEPPCNRATLSTTYQAEGIPLENGAAGRNRTFPAPIPRVCSTFELRLHIFLSGHHPYSGLRNEESNCGSSDKVAEGFQDDGSVGFHQCGRLELSICARLDSHPPSHTTSKDRPEWLPATDEHENSHHATILLAPHPSAIFRYTRGGVSHVHRHKNSSRVCRSDCRTKCSGGCLRALVHLCRACARPYCCAMQRRTGCKISICVFHTGWGHGRTNIAYLHAGVPHPCAVSRNASAKHPALWRDLNVLRLTCSWAYITELASP